MDLYEPPITGLEPVLNINRCPAMNQLPHCLSFKIACPLCKWYAQQGVVVAAAWITVVVTRISGLHPTYKLRVCGGLAQSSPGEHRAGNSQLRRDDLPSFEIGIFQTVLEGSMQNAKGACMPNMQKAAIDKHVTCTCAYMHRISYMDYRYYILMCLYESLCIMILFKKQMLQNLKGRL